MTRMMRKRPDPALRDTCLPNEPNLGSESNIIVWLHTSGVLLHTDRVDVHRVRSDDEIRLCPPLIAR